MNTLLANALIVALSTTFFAVVWFDTEIAEPIRSSLQRLFANQGWREETVGENDQRAVTIVERGPWRAPYRWLWNLISCPLCIGTHVSFWQVAYITRDLWTREQWLTFGAATGVYFFLVRAWQTFNQKLGLQ